MESTLGRLGSVSHHATTSRCWMTEPREICTELHFARMMSQSMPWPQRWIAHENISIWNFPLAAETTTATLVIPLANWIGMVQSLVELSSNITKWKKKQRHPAGIVAPFDRPEWCSPSSKRKVALSTQINYILKLNCNTSEYYEKKQCEKSERRFTHWVQCLHDCTTLFLWSSQKVPVWSCLDQKDMKRASTI